VIINDPPEQICRAIPAELINELAKSSNILLLLASVGILLLTLKLFRHNLTLESAYRRGDGTGSSKNSINFQQR
jgi:hypothetical protein